MATLRRILKYTPAVVLGLLVVAWVVSWFLSIKVVTHDRANFAFRLVGGSLYILWDESDFGERLLSVSRHEFQLPDSLLGKCDYARLVFVGGGGLSYVGLGIPAMATVLLPLAFGPFLSFRFRLWHYLAYTALVAVELAYYLRWQE